MKTLEKKTATESLADYIDRIGNDTIIITEGNKPVAALVPIENTDMETLSLSTNPQFLSIIQRSRQRQQREGGLSSDDVRRLFESE